MNLVNNNITVLFCYKFQSLSFIMRTFIVTCNQGHSQKKITRVFMTS